MQNPAKPSIAEIISRLEARVEGAEKRLAPLELAALHCADEADREADRMLRDFVKWLKLSAKFGGILAKASPVLFVIAALIVMSSEPLKAAFQQWFGGQQP